MTSAVVTVDAQQPVAEAARLMRDADVGVLPVAADGHIVGIITDRDIVVRGAASGRLDMRVGDLMTTGFVGVTPEDDDREVENLMVTREIRRLPVIEDGLLVGIVTVGDLAVRTSEKRAGKVLARTGPNL